MSSKLFKIRPTSTKSVDIGVNLCKIVVYEQIICKASDVMVFDLLRKDVKVSDFLVY